VKPAPFSGEWSISGHGSIHRLEPKVVREPRYRTIANTIFHVTDGAGEPTQLARNILSGSAATPSLRGWRPHEDTAV